MNGSWASFFTAEVSASAALAGLIFVGVSINLTKILSAMRLVDYALEALIVLFVALIVSSLHLVPAQPYALLGIEVLVVGLAAWIVVCVRQGDNARSIERSYRGLYTWHVIMGQAATLPFVIDGIALIAVGRLGLYWAVPGVIFSFLDAFYLGWVLLIEINR